MGIVHVLPMPAVQDLRIVAIHLVGLPCLRDQFAGAEMRLAPHGIDVIHDCLDAIMVGIVAGRSDQRRVENDGGRNRRATRREQF